ncbi:hypothetical protein WA026_011832 [Henosepilachna vigintioctopunctata]|uniref:Myb-like domain-containing protein n=1 Tax=Henosepilachna vigintioctopunctata TaxID=420089 RepID=A0AAW1UKG7_9CUCU
MAKFLRNLEVYFKDQPSQLRKIHKSLLEMQQTSNITLEKVKTVILPLLRGNPLLCDGFLQIFLEESPPSILLNDTYENIDVNKELNKADEEVVFESIAVSDVEDTACVCPCHKVDEQQPIKQHCLHCGLRFLQGKVYCQTGRGLKSVNVTFPYDLDVDHNARLGVVNKLKRLDHNQSHPKTHSPNREGLDEHRSYKYIDDIDKGKNSKGCRSPKKTKPNAKKLCTISKDKDFLSKSIKSSPKKLTGDLCKQNKRKRIDFCDKSCSVLINKPDICSKQIENLVDVIGRQNLPPPEYLDIHSSDSDFSQDEYAECKKRKSKFSKNKSNWDMWSREEDKIILQTFQQKFSEEAIQLIANQLKNRSANEIRSRFEILMMLLQEMEST